ncbi:MAG: patatin-like phospholipase family protein [Rubrivivax sp.]
MPALQVFAGPRARARLAERGLSPADVRVVPGAAGGPKGLVLNPLDRFIFGDWLKSAPQTVHLPGASIGAWRLACACLPDADAALAELAEDYITQRYEHAPGKAPTPRSVSAAFGRKLEERLGARAAEVLSHPQRRLHVFTSRGRHLLRREGRWRTPAGYLGAFVANAASRRALGAWLERVVFGDPRDPLPVPMHDLRSHVAALTPANLTAAVLASCSIPFWLDAVHDVPGGPRGAYWDGGITDYHLHLDYAAMGEGLVLYPHFQRHVVPGWLDKAWKRRHCASAFLDNVVVLVPSAAWIATLPNAKLPDRNDFKAYADDFDGRVAAWRRALAESARLADEFAELVAGGKPLAAEPLP